MSGAPFGLALDRICALENTRARLAELRRAFDLLGEIEDVLDPQIEEQRCVCDSDEPAHYAIDITEGQWRRFTEAMTLLERALAHRWDREELAPGHTVRDEMRAKNRDR